MSKRWVSFDGLDALFGIEPRGEGFWDEEFVEDICISPCNPEQLDEWRLHKTEEEELSRRQNISETFLSISPDGWRELNSHRKKNNPQCHQIVLDGQTFVSKNAAARYAMKKYSVSRNTAIRYIDENRPFDKMKQSGRDYTGDYTATKYDE